MNKMLTIDKVVESVSITHKFDKPVLSFLNTSDVENGKVINVNRMSIAELKGQAKKTIKKDDILFSEIRPKNRRFAYVDFDDTNEFVVSTKLMVLRSKNPEIDIKYFYYYLTSDYMLSILQDRAENRIGSFPQITFDLLSEYSIRVPALIEQQKIVAVLSSLDSKIELNNKINNELEEMANFLYNYWFVQFDFPDENGKPYKSSGGKMVWNDELKREIPEGWSVANFYENNLCSIISPGIIDFTGEKTYIPTACIQNSLIISFENKITFNNRESRANMQPKNNSVWFAKMKNTNKKIYFGEYSTEYLNNLILSTGMCGLECNKKIYFEYIISVINSNDFDKIKDVFAHGSTQQAISNGDLKNINILIPEELILEKFNKISKNLFHQKYLKEIENQLLTKQRDFLLPMLMNGQITVN